MVVFYKHSEIDETKWDRCISSSTQSVVFARYRFLSIATPEWGALVEGDYEAVMPLPIRRKCGITYVCTPCFYARLGIFSSQTLTASDVQRFLAAIPHHFCKVDITGTPSMLDLLPDKAVRYSHQLSLNSDYATLFQSYATNHKRNVKAARKFQLTLDKRIPVEDIISLFKNNRGKDKMINIKPIDYGFFLEMTKHALSLQILENWGVRDERGDLLAAGCFLRDGNRIWFWFSGRDEQQHPKRAMFFLIDAYIQTYAAQPLILDFNGSMNENVARFYHGFGSHRYAYPVLSLTPNRWLQPLVKLYQKIHN